MRRTLLVLGWVALLALVLLLALLLTRVASHPIAPRLASPTAFVLPAHCEARGALPDPICTPGAADPRVTQANIGTTICVAGYTDKVRPPSSQTAPLERDMIARYGLAITPAESEFDHLISLELGGAPLDIRNLWPEPYAGEWGARRKDALENRLHVLVCQGKITLADAQHLVVTDWVAAYRDFVGP